MWSTLANPGCEGEARNHCRLCSCMGKQWPGAGISTMSPPRAAGADVHRLLCAEESGSRIPRPCGGGSVVVLRARCWPRAAAKHWNEVAPCLCRGRSPHTHRAFWWWGARRGSVALQQRPGREGGSVSAGHSCDGASWKVMRLDSWLEPFPAAPGSGSSGLSVLTVTSSSSSSMLGQADWSSTRFSRSFRAFRASCLWGKGRQAGYLGSGRHGTVNSFVSGSGSFPAGEGGFSSTGGDPAHLGLPHRNTLRLHMQGFHATWSARKLSDGTQPLRNRGKTEQGKAECQCLV